MGNVWTTLEPTQPQFSRPSTATGDPRPATTSRSSGLPVTSLLALSSSTTELNSVTPPSVVSPLLLLPEVMSQPFSTSIPPPTRNKSRPTLQKTACPRRLQLQVY